MASIEVGRVCVKTAGREAGERCAIIDIIDDNFVEVVGEGVKNRRCNMYTFYKISVFLLFLDDLNRFNPLRLASRASYLSTLYPISPADVLHMHTILDITV